MNASIVLDVLLEASVRAALVALLVGATLAAFRVKAPSVRHAAWTSVLLVTLALPVTSRVLPTVPLPTWLPQIRLATETLGPAGLGFGAVMNPSPTTEVQPRGPAQSSTRSAVDVPVTKTAASMPLVATRPSWTWQPWIVLAWFGVALVLLSREVVGALMARRLAASGSRVDDDSDVFASERIITPVVVGVWSPRVMVPPSWPKWGAGVREMVALHERAHIVRRDPLVACLARVNRAIFWFHPLSWWLQRHLARTAEEACDELVVRAVPEPRVYAALLVEMARRLHHHKGRVAWQGIGVVDGRRFEDRVDRVLKGASPQLSRRRMAALGVVSTLLTSLAVACGTAAAPLAEDPELAKKISAAAVGFANYQVATKMDLAQATELEKVVASNPDDLDATSKLLTFYLSQGHKVMGWNQMVAARRPHLLRMIERHPESFLATWRLSRRLDPEGYETARGLWLSHAERPDASLAVLSQAAAFFERVEKPLAEELLLRAQAKDPNGPTPRTTVTGVSRVSWSGRLGRLYAMAITGSHDRTMWDDVTVPDVMVLQSPFATQARQKLEQSNDPELLLEASNFLINYAASARLPFDPIRLGREYATKVLQLDPGSPQATHILSGPQDRIKAHNLEYEEMLKRFGKPVHQLSDSEIQLLPASVKLEHARAFLWAPYGKAMRAYQKKDKQIAEAEFDRLKSRTEWIQRLVENSDPSAVPAGLQFQLHVAFGTVAMHQGNRQEAVRRLGVAVSTASAGAVLEDLGLGVAASKLAYDLLDAGERESVASFYEAVAPKFRPQWKTRYEEAATAIRQGRMPVDYQRYRAGLE
jgi:beta-lactamase regulating signal transducer with metallopeptidase domain